MIGWTLTVFGVAVAAAVLGFGGFAGSLTDAAKLVSVLAVALVLVSAVFGVMRGRSPRT